MTLQNDLARPWFQPVVPSDPPPPDVPAATVKGAMPAAAGPLTTRIEGELPLDEVLASRRTAPDPAVAGSVLPAGTSVGVGNDPVSPAERVEVTQPYIPAIRTEQPEFAKRLNPDPGPQTHAQPPPPPVTPNTAGRSTTTTAETSGPTRAGQTAPTPATPKSWFRRAVRRIIGPDLLRKDPPTR